MPVQLKLDITGGLDRENPRLGGVEGGIGSHCHRPQSPWARTRYTMVGGDDPCSTDDKLHPLHLHKSNSTAVEECAIGIASRHCKGHSK